MDPCIARPRERLRRVGGAIVAVALLATGALYLVGSILLWTLHLKPQNATPATFIRYVYWYWDRPPVRRRIVGSGLGSTLVVGVAGLVAFLPRRTLKRRPMDSAGGTGEPASALDPELDRAVQAFLAQTTSGKTSAPYRGPGRSRTAA